MKDNPIFRVRVFNSPTRIKEMEGFEWIEVWDSNIDETSTSDFSMEDMRPLFEIISKFKDLVERKVAEWKKRNGNLKTLQLDTENGIPKRRSNQVALNFVHLA